MFVVFIKEDHCSVFVCFCCAFVVFVLIIFLLFSYSKQLKQPPDQRKTYTKPPTLADKHKRSPPVVEPSVPGLEKNEHVVPLQVSG